MELFYHMLELICRNARNNIFKNLNDSDKNIDKLFILQHYMIQEIHLMKYLY